ncbi:MAG: hypothetical protein FJ399_18250, partial [Verrucomicrobia bacterium]|nr:hypothetical protein [Verrucomicrobiota bacterium]
MSPPNMPLKILINGAKGRMGQALAAAARECGLEICGATDVGDDLAAFLPAANIIVDFSSPEATHRLL